MSRKFIVALLGGVAVLFAACGTMPQPVTSSPAAAHLHPSSYTATARVEAYQRKTVSVSCPRGEQMIGGGVGTSDLFEFAAYVEASYPSSSATWTVTAYAPASFFAVEAQVYCLPATVPLGIQRVRARGDAPEGVVCPHDTTVLGGGFASSDPVGAFRPQRNGWVGASVTELYALCAAHHVRPGNVVTTIFNAHSSSRGYTPGAGAVTCPTGQIAAGGGFAGGDLILASEASGPSLNGWSVAAGGDAEVTLSAVCVLLQR